MSTLQILSQESGWVDSAGYKQQRYKTGEIKQLLYTSTGDTIITVTKDSVWHRYLWDTKSGKLLNTTNLTQLFSTKLYNVFFSADQTTYSVVIRNNDSVRIKLLHRHNDKSFFDTVLKVKDFDSCQVFYHNTSKIMWIMINTFSNYEDMVTQKFSANGKLVKIAFSENKVTKSQEYEGKSLYIELYDEYKKITRTKVYTYYYQFRAEDATEEFDIHTQIITDSVISFESYQDRDLRNEKTGKYQIVSQGNLCNQGNIFTVMIDRNCNSLINPEMTSVQKKELPFFPFIVKEAISHNHLLLIRNKNFVLYNYANNTFSKTELFPASVNDVEFRKNNLTMTLACTDGFLRIKDLTLYDTSTKSTFKSSHRLRYIQNNILFTSQTKKQVRTFHWDFGDGSFSSLQHPIHSYSIADTFTVKLILKYNDGTGDSIVQHNAIITYPELQSRFSISERFGSPPLKVDFQDMSTGYINKWLWDFGDGNTSNAPNPTHRYSKTGYYTVSLKVSDSLSSSLYFYPRLIVSNEYHIDSLNIYAIKYPKAYFSTEKDEKISTSYKKGFFDSADNNLILFFQDENRFYKYINGQTSDQYIITQGLINWRNDNFYNRYTIYENNDSKLLREEGIPYHIYKKRKGNYITSFEAYTDYKYPYLQAIVSTNKFAFAPSGWSHDFNGVFLPDGTDIFLFRNKQSNLQFFYNDTTAFHRLDFSAQFSDIFAMPDSLSCLLFTNPAFDFTDSTNSFILNTLDNKGNLLREVKIPKTINAAITCLRPLDHDSFIIAGYTGTRNDKGQIIDKNGYIALININGFIEWHNIIPTYSDIRTIQKHPNNYFAALGLPHANQKHGFIAFRENGKILADFRLFDAHSSFYPNDFIVGNKEHDIWFIGEEYIENQGKRATVYSCNNPVTPTTDIDESLPLTLSNNDMTVYPNPAHDLITLTNVSEKYSIFDSMGNVLMQSHSDRLDISHLPNGIYFIKSHTINSKTMSFIIQR
ncbi:MAG: PKD domain-containing protein [Candidatus Kapaibacterium sp.]